MFNHQVTRASLVRNVSLVVALLFGFAPPSGSRSKR